MRCTHCQKDIHVNPWIVLLHQVCVLAVVTFWFYQIVDTWDNEPYILGAIFVTMLGLAFGKDKVPELLRKFTAMPR